MTTYVGEYSLDLILENNSLFLNRFLKDSKSGVAVYSVPDLLLLKANDIYIRYVSHPDIPNQNIIGMKIREFVPQWDGSLLEKTLEDVILTNETIHLTEQRGLLGSHDDKYWNCSFMPLDINAQVKFIVCIWEDVSLRVYARIKNEEYIDAIKKQAEKLQVITENMDDALFIINQDGSYNYINRRGQEMLDCQDKVKQDGDNVSSVQYFDEDGNPLEKEGMPGKRVLKGEKLKNVVLRVVIAEQTGYCSFNGSPVYDTEGAVVSAVLCIRDIGEKYRHEKELKEKKDQIDAIIENMSDAIYVFDGEGKYTLLNKAAHMVMNDRDFHKVGADYEPCRYFDMDDNEITYAQMPYNRVLAGEKFSEQILYVVTPNGIKYLGISGSPLFDKDEKLCSGIICARDITEAKQQWQIIKQQKEQLEGIIENMSDGIAVVDREGNYLITNRRLKQFLERSNAAVNNEPHVGGKNYWGICYDQEGKRIAPEDYVPVRVLKGEQVEEQRITVKYHGEVFYYDVSGTPILDSNNGVKTAIICIREVTAHVELENLLLASRDEKLRIEMERNKELQAILNMKDEFLGTISHEFKTPLNVIIAAIQAIENIHKDEINEHVRKHIHRIRMNTFRQLRLVNNLLDITRFNAGHIKVLKENLDIVFLSRAITKSVDLYAKQKGVDLHFSSAFECKLMAIDEEKYERILINLLSNAIKFTPKGKSVYVNVTYKNKKVYISVRDEGIGIPERKLAVIFERFGQVDSSLSRQAEGTGIGLSLVKALVTGLGGAVSVTSKLGAGSEFVIVLPVTKVRRRSKLINKESISDCRIMQAVSIEFSDIYLD